VCGCACNAERQSAELRHFGGGIVVGEAGVEDEGVQTSVLLLVLSYLAQRAFIIATSIMPGTPLPPPTSPDVAAWAEYEPGTLKAYSACLEYESKLVTSEDRVRLVRLLGYLLLYAPRRTIRSKVANWIHSRKPGSDLADLGEFFETHVIVACEFRYQIQCILRINCLVQLRNTEDELPLRPVTCRGPPLKEREAQ
jgi:hypothetical protein